MFSASVALNRNVSCGTNPIWRRSHSGSRSRRSTPSRKTAPSVGSIKRGIKLTSVLLPLPVWPTIATVAPAGISSEMFLSAYPAGYFTSTSSKRSCPRMEDEEYEEYKGDGEYEDSRR